MLGRDRGFARCSTGTEEAACQPATRDHAAGILHYTDVYSRIPNLSSRMQPSYGVQNRAATDDVPAARQLAAALEGRTLLPVSTSCTPPSIQCIPIPNFLPHCPSAPTPPLLSRIRTSSPEAQALFSQSMALLAGYNQAEAVASLRAALTFDPHCAMCYWGLAYARSEAWGGRAIPFVQHILQ